MNSILSALLNAGIASGLIVTVIWFGMRLAPRRMLNAATRYTIWYAALAITAGLPALCLRPAPSPVRPMSVGDRILSQDGSIRGGWVQPADAAPTSSSRVSIEVFGGRWLPWTLAALAAMSFLKLARLTASYVMLERRKSRAVDAPPDLASRVDTWIQLGGGKRKNVRLAVSTEVPSPIAAGPGRPAILIPARLLNDLSDDELEQVGLHEAAHLARRDDYALLLQRSLEALFAFHPVVRWIGRRIDLEREVACDDLVIAATGRAAAYAECLTKVIELTGGVRGQLLGAAAAGQRSDFTKRVEMLLDMTRHTGTSLLRMRLTAAGALLAALVWTAVWMPPALRLVAQQIPASRWVPVSVVDPLNRFVTGLDKDSFRLMEDKVEQELSSVSSEDKSVSVGFVCQIGDRSRLESARTALTAFMSTTDPKTEFYLVNGPKLIVQFTTDGTEIANRLTFDPAQDSLAAAVRIAMTEMTNARHRKRAILIFTDGPLDEQVLRREFADGIMGNIFAVGENANPSDATVKYGIELRNQYLLEYVPKNPALDGAYRNVEVRLVQPRGLPRLRVKTSAGYHAAPQ